MLSGGREDEETLGGYCVPFVVKKVVVDGLLPHASRQRRGRLVCLFVHSYVVPSLECAYARPASYCASKTTMH